MTDLGWLNDGGDTYAKITQAETVCLKLGHTRTDKDEGPYAKGLGHVVRCQACGYQYHYDSSD